MIVNYQGSDNVLWVSPSVYERILNNPDSIIIESQCQPPLELKVIGGQPMKKENEI